MADESWGQKKVKDRGGEVWETGCDFKPGIFGAGEMERCEREVERGVYKAEVPG